MPVFIKVTKRHAQSERPKIALRAVLVSAGTLLFFLVAGQFLLHAMEVPLDAFQVAGGIILFLFALTMIFGESKPEQELQMTRHYKETAIFPLAVPCIASPGAMMAVVVLTDKQRFSAAHQASIAVIGAAVLFATYLLLLSSKWILGNIGDSGGSILSRVMGMLLVSVAAANGAVLGGICHGPLGLLKATTANGEPLVAGRRVTAVTDKQVDELGIGATPQHPETELRKLGGIPSPGPSFLIQLYFYERPHWARGLRELCRAVPTQERVSSQVSVNIPRVVWPRTGHDALNFAGV